jgi:TetR/AcrR family transcriptional repressor of nem operon
MQGVSSTPTTTRPRGRPREFDRDEVLDKVMMLFWEKGFEGTAMADIVVVSGLNKSSLYNTFGSKDELFGLVLDRYLELRKGMLTEYLVAGTRGLDDVEAFLAYVRSESQGEMGRMGCLAVNTSTECVGNDAMTEVSLRFRDELRAALRAAFGRAEAAGEIEPGTVDRDTAILVSFMMSLPVLSRSGAAQTELDTHFDALASVLADWRR